MSDYERIFAGNKQIMMGHFYSLGRENLEYFSVGYWTPDNFYFVGIWAFDGEVFSCVSHTWAQDKRA